MYHGVTVVYHESVRKIQSEYLSVSECQRLIMGVLGEFNVSAGGVRWECQRSTMEVVKSI